MSVWSYPPSETALLAPLRIHEAPARIALWPHSQRAIARATGLRVASTNTSSSSSSHQLFCWPALSSEVR